MAVQLSARDLMIAFDLPDGGTLPALGPISFGIEAGSFVCLVGPSGCGKSTLIRVLAGLLPPTHGQVCADQTVITTPSRRIGLMFQDANLMPWRTVRDNIALPLELAGLSKAARYQAVRDILPRLRLADFADAYPGELSGGMAQRVALGRVLVQQPDALLLDEPFGALDAMTREQISIDLVNLWMKARQTIVMVTHDIHEAAFLADRVLVFSRRPGRIAADIRVTQERPRRLDDVYEGRFAEIARQVRASLESA